MCGDKVCMICGQSVYLKDLECPNCGSEKFEWITIPDPFAAEKGLEEIADEAAAAATDLSDSMDEAACAVQDAAEGKTSWARAVQKATEAVMGAANVRRSAANMLRQARKAEAAEAEAAAAAMENEGGPTP